MTAIATNAILDEERDKRSIGLLGKDDNPKAAHARIQAGSGCMVTGDAGIRDVASRS